MQDTARGLAALDVLAALAETAGLHNYTKPLMHAGDELQAADVRHPIVERHATEASCRTTSASTAPISSWSS